MKFILVIEIRLLVLPKILNHFVNNVLKLKLRLMLLLILLSGKMMYQCGNPLGNGRESALRNWKSEF